MTCESCGSYEIERTKCNGKVIHRCLECGYTREYPIRRIPKKLKKLQKEARFDLEETPVEDRIERRK